MSSTADVVIIGGGVIGASVAYHLAARGQKRIVVLDRAQGPGLGSTGRATGGFRGQFSTRVNVQLSLLARDKLAAFRDETGADPGYRTSGYLFVASNSDQLAALRTAAALQQAAGLRDVREVTPGEVVDLNPTVPRDAVTGGTYCPTDGFIRPLEILRGYLAAAQRLGARVQFGTGWARCLVEHGRVTAVRTETETVATSCVINAAGAWAGAVAAEAGVEMPVRPVRRQVAVTYPAALLPEEMPMTIFVDDGFHLRVRDGRVLLLWPADLPADDPFDTAFDARWLTPLLDRARAHVPILRGLQIDRDACWAGLYEMSADRHAVLGRAPGVEGLYLANGSSGHGVMHAPALGHLTAEFILDGTATTVDVHALRPERFAEGALNPESGVL
ncbi:MAG TPA: FAD-dependent oxidoreductase [bacterium]|nr:FAD-dependent oxidoreductase [bacterium]